MGKGPAEKAKNFKGAIKRLFGELGKYRKIVVVAVVLAIISAVLSILAPNRLSKLTDEIQKGLVVNQDNMMELSEKVGENFSKGSNESIYIDDVEVSIEDQYKYMGAMGEITDKSNAKELYGKIDEMPDSVKEVIKPKMDIDAIKKIALVLASFYIVSAIFSFIQSIAMAVVSNKFAKELRSRISVKINKLPLRYFDKHQFGDILSRVTNDVDTIGQNMNQSLGTLVTNVTLFLGSIVMMFYTNWIMALTAIGTSIIGFIGMGAILGKSQKYFEDRQRELGKLNGHIEEIYSGLNVVKAYNGKSQADKKFDELNEKVRISNEKSQFLSGIMMPLMMFIGNFGYVAVCIVGALLTMNNIITFGVIVAFMIYVRLFTNPLSQIAQAMTALQSTAAASERVFEFTDEVEMDSQENITKSLNKDEVKGHIEFNNVVFQYDNNDKPTIKNFTAEAKPGQKVAIVGPTGAGKTTMVNLLMKFYDINSGDIRIDGVSTKDLTRENIHELFTMVLQDTWLFEGTIKENIVYNRENVTDDMVHEVCREVGLDHFIRTLPHGYDASIAENDSVSAGQRQLLTIARGMIENSPFLILDEATSNVDTRTEELVQKAMDKLTEGKTSFIIAHRLSTIKNADLILVMKEGNIIEQGNHEELLEKNGFYAELYNSQFEECID
ncbi:MAG: ABC transporter ATP-binding protein [Clostridia bacterium]|nr:ABC transporter ATP-binding protein [Clostridia bacterium]